MESIKKKALKIFATCFEQIIVHQLFKLRRVSG